MKKALATLMAATMCFSLAVLPGFAASFDQNSTEAIGTTFSFDYKNDPTYTVTIPDAVTMDKDGSDVNIVAENVANLDGKKISVTIAGTDQFRDQMLMEGKTEDGKTGYTRYQFILEDGTVVEAAPDNANGTELVSFTDNGTKTFQVKPVISFSSSQYKGVLYTGQMTYGISLVDAE